MANKKSDIIDKAVDLILEQGIRLASVDKIASSCGISKKTFYRYFESKEAMLMELVLIYSKDVEQFLRLNGELAPNAMAEMLAYDSFFEKKFRYVLPDVFVKLRRYYPDVTEIIEYQKKHVLEPFIVQNLDRGIKEGFYKNTIDKQLDAKVYCYQQEQLLHDVQLKREERHQISRHIAYMFLRSIATQKGEVYLSLRTTE
ncbi:TetR/AcrR family transcriptional regulator [Leeuwenhoekiella sp. H156]|uniref:TetR/AcrR family transcriptional regulator n=1 Tax=Leeuwenhoekiella sp. H156 TaxID=3450128 RepID=UPI003FA4B9FF